MTTSGARRDGSGLGLALFAREEPEAPLAWAQIDLRTKEIVARGDSAPPAAAAARTVLILSGSDAQIRQLLAPSRTQAQARAGVAYLFEGALADPDDVHFAVGEAQDSDGRRLAAALSGARLSAWLGACRRAGADPHAVYLDVTLWPGEANTAVVALSGERALVCGGPHGGYAIEAAIAPSLFARWASQNSLRTTSIRVDERALESWRRILPDAALSPLTPSDVDGDLARAAFSPPEFAPNLRQGAFAVAGARRPQWRLWSLAGAIAVVGVLAQSGMQAYAGWRDEQATAAVLEQTQTAFKAARPDVTRIVNLRAQVRAAVNAAGRAGAHPVLKAGEPLRRAGLAQPLVRLEDMRHQAPDRTVQLRFSAGDAQSLQALLVWFQAQGIKAEMKDQAPEGGRYIALVTMESPP